MNQRIVYPFTAIVGQERMCRALVLNAVDPRIGGVLIRGERGTAKSTAARALAALLPEEEAIEGCRFGCDPHDPTHWCTECIERAAASMEPYLSSAAQHPSSTCPFLPQKTVWSGRWISNVPSKRVNATLNPAS